MKIALLGYGKMGKVLEEIALRRNHFIVKKISTSNYDEINSLNKDNCDIVIEFSNPNSAFANIKICLEKQIPVVSGTTGEWLKRKYILDDICLKNKTAFLWASNFSIGVNLFFETNAYLAKKTQNLRYTIKIEESHHLEKKDVPSGTALTLKKKMQDFTDEIIEIKSHRILNEIGTHKVIFESSFDRIEVKHKAQSRVIYALGAINAAEFLLDKKGIYKFEDVLNEMTSQS